MIAATESRGEPSASCVLVTGATGFVGRNLLPLAPTVRFRAAMRTISPSRQDGVETVAVGNIDARTDWSPALAGVDCVVHLAARVHVMNPTPTIIAGSTRSISPAPGAWGPLLLKRA